MRILGMHNTRKTTGKERNTFTRLVSLGTVDTALGSSLECLLGHAAVNHAQINAGLLKDVTVAKDAGHAPAAILADPGILLEGCLAVNVLDGLGDLDLSLADHLFELGAHRIVAFRAGLARTNERFWRGILHCF